MYEDYEDYDNYDDEPEKDPSADSYFEPDPDEYCYDPDQDYD